jgi:predicted glycosyltransferase
MPVGQRLAFQARAERDPRLQAITFEARVEAFFQQARAVVAMGGYNTFCEILSFGKPALLVPRTTPRLEQYLRAERAQALGLVRMLPDDGYRAPGLMADALRSLPDMPVLPDAVRAPMLQGLERIAKLAGPWLGPGRVGDDLRRTRYA